LKRGFFIAVILRLTGNHRGGRTRGHFGKSPTLPRIRRLYGKFQRTYLESNKNIV